MEFTTPGFTKGPAVDESKTKLSGATISLTINKNDIVNCVAMKQGANRPTVANIIDAVKGGDVVDPGAKRPATANRDVSLRWILCVAKTAYSFVFSSLSATAIHRSCVFTPCCALSQPL